MSRAEGHTLTASVKLSADGFRSWTLLAVSFGRAVRCGLSEAVLCNLLASKSCLLRALRS